VFGRIDRDLVVDKVKDLKERIFFIFGPPKMVEAMQEICRDLEIDRESLKSESFLGILKVSKHFF